ncbi:MAG: PD-(D/E)XK nuclease domain-containing protein, partial [Clostridia bacterium]|nr:PD-(D/E)XK nuclease domain-containing protein [Clostridia bacterium]
GKDERTDLKQLAKAALSQIREKRYETEMMSQGIEIIYRYGVAFRGKDVEIAMG